MTTTIDVDGTETDVDVHWGCQFLRPDGSEYITRWDPSHGSGINTPYTEAEARADVRLPANLPPGYRKVLVTRTVTTTVTTTTWTEVPS